jgi:hypothetical protein
MNIHETIKRESQYLTTTHTEGRSRPIVRGHGKALVSALIPFPDYSVWVALHEDGLYSVQAARGGFKVGQAGAGSAGDLRALIERAVRLCETEIRLASTKRRKRVKR